MKTYMCRKSYVRDRGRWIKIRKTLRDAYIGSKDVAMIAETEKEMKSMMKTQHKFFDGKNLTLNAIK